MSRIIALHRDICSFQQNERECITAAWYIFLSLIESGPVLSIPESLFLRNFYEGLNKYSAFYLDVVSGGSFPLMTLAKGREFLYDIIDSKAFTIMPELLREICKSNQEVFLEVKSNLSSSTSLDSALETSPELGTLEGEEIHPPKFSY